MASSSRFSLPKIIYLNYIDIIKHLHEKKQIMINVFEALRGDSYPALQMIEEICQILKTNEAKKEDMYRMFADYNLYEYLEELQLRLEKEPQPPPAEIPRDKKEATVLSILTLSLKGAGQHFRNYLTSER